MSQRVGESINESVLYGINSSIQSLSYSVILFIHYSYFIINATLHHMTHSLIHLFRW